MSDSSPREPAAKRVDPRREDDDPIDAPAAPSQAPRETMPSAATDDAATATAPVTTATAVATAGPDPRVSEVEPLLRRGDWPAVLALLGPADQTAALPPNLAVLYAVARKEREALGEAADGLDATALAIRSMAALLGVSDSSALAMVVAKRVVRQNPIAWQKRPAPPARVSALIIVLTAAIGSVVGWLLASGHVTVRF